MADETGALVPAEEELQDNAETAGEEESGEQASQDQGETVEEHKKRLSGAQRNKIRIERLENELQEERRQRQQLLDHVLKQSSGEKKETAKPTNEDPEPKPEDFMTGEVDDQGRRLYDGEKLAAALRGWDRRQAKREAIEEIEKKQAERDKAKARESDNEKVANTWREREASVEAKYDDYQELTTVAIKFLQGQEHSPTAQALGAAITESEAGPELLRKLGEDFDTLERISKLSPTAAVRELGKIEARLAPEESAEEDEAEEPEPTVPPVKQPPKPPTPVKKVSSIKKPDINDPNIPFKEFVKLREAQIKGK